MKYKIGDRVRVREDLEIGKRYGGETFVPEMANMVGRCVTIADMEQDKCAIHESYYTWTDEMFSGYAIEADSVDWERAKEEKIAVICPTKREYIALMEDCENRGYRWMSGDTPLSLYDYPKTCVYLHPGKALTWGNSADLKSPKTNLPVFTYRLPELEKVTAPLASERPSWRLEIWSDGDKTHGEIYDGKGSMLARETVTRYHADEYNRKAAIEALTAKLFRPSPKFKEGDIVRGGDDFYYRIKGEAVWSGDKWEYNPHVSRGRDPRTRIAESHLSLVCRAEDVAE